MVYVFDVVGVGVVSCLVDCVGCDWDFMVFFVVRFLGRSCDLDCW